MIDLREQIALIVESKLAFTNGWKIPDDDYTAKCSETADEIISLVRADYEQKVIEAVRGLSEGRPRAEWRGGYESALGEAVEAIKQLFNETDNL